MQQSNEKKTIFFVAYPKFEGSFDKPTDLGKEPIFL